VPRSRRPTTLGCRPDWCANASWLRFRIRRRSRTTIPTFRRRLLLRTREASFL